MPKVRDMEKMRRLKGLKNENMDQDVTRGLPDEAFEQENQDIKYPEINEKGEEIFNFKCGGMGRAYKGGKFIGCK